MRPAKLLGIEAEVGSLEAGKRADLVIWDSEPFSGTAAVEQVWIEGKPVWGSKETK
jgi:imidazolonepropionase-like amidohydrolase